MPKANKVNRPWWECLLACDDGTYGLHKPTRSRVGLTPDAEFHAC